MLTNHLLPPPLQHLSVSLANLQLHLCAQHFHHAVSHPLWADLREKSPELVLIIGLIGGSQWLTNFCYPRYTFSGFRSHAVGKCAYVFCEERKKRRLQLTFTSEGRRFCYPVAVNFNCCYFGWLVLLNFQVGAVAQVITCTEW